MRHLHMGLDPQCFVAAIVEFPKNSFKICCLQNRPVVKKGKIMFSLVSDLFRL